MRKRATVRSQPETDSAVRAWSELALLEQGSLGIVRHLQQLLEGVAITPLFDEALAERAAFKKPRRRTDSVSTAK